jgi:hypothetical protein
LLNGEEDSNNAALIRNIRIRYAQAPRTITKKTFKRESKSFMPVKAALYGKYRKGLYWMLNTTQTQKDEDREIICYADWRSFKDWCIDMGYITRYRTEDETV